MQKQINLKIPLSASRGLPLALGAFVLGGGLLKSNGKIVG